MTDYIPHEWYDQPRARLLRTLRCFDWVDFEDLRAALDLPSVVEDRRMHDTYYQNLRGLVRQGIVEIRDRDRLRKQFRLKVRVSWRELVSAGERKKGGAMTDEERSACSSRSRLRTRTRHRSSAWRGRTGAKKGSEEERELLAVLVKRIQGGE